MSLSSHLRDKNSPIRDFIRSQFPNTSEFLKEDRRWIKNAPAIRPDAELPYSTIGTAVDYRIRYYFDITPHSELVAFKGATNLMEIPASRLVARGRVPIPSDEVAIEPHVVLDFFRSLDELTLKNNPLGRRLTAGEEDALNRYCVALALFEQVFRAGLSANSPLVTGNFADYESLLGIAESHWLDDLKNLSWKFFDEYEHLLQLPHTLNPKFDGSGYVGGADADLVIDRKLIDVKTTVKPEINSDWIWQLLGYVLLDFSDKNQINAIGLYMARQGVLVDWDLAEALEILCPGNPPSIAELRSQFKDVVEDFLGLFDHEFSTWSIS